MQTVNTLRNKRFSHIDKQFDSTENNTCTIFLEQNKMIAVQAPCLFFLKLCAHANYNSRQQYKS